METGRAMPSAPAISCEIITCTYPSLETARHAAAALIEDRLAACVQIGSPITSLYRWNDRVETALEFPLSIKTASDRSLQAMETLRALHPYDVPEIICQAVSAGLPAYLNWVIAETRARPPLDQE